MERLNENKGDVSRLINFHAAAGSALAILKIGRGTRTRLNCPDLVSTASTRTKLSAMTIGSPATSNVSPYSLIQFPCAKPNRFSLVQTLRCCFVKGLSLLLALRFARKRSESLRFDSRSSAHRPAVTPTLRDQQ